VGSGQPVMPMIKLGGEKAGKHTTCRSAACCGYLARLSSGGRSKLRIYTLVLLANLHDRNVYALAMQIVVSDKPFSLGRRGSFPSPFPGSILQSFHIRRKLKEDRITCQILVPSADLGFPDREFIPWRRWRNPFR
jgi:hypothetical protein